MIRSAPQDRAAGVFGGRAQHLLDADQLVVFRQPVRPREAAGLDLAAIGGDGQIGIHGTNQPASIGNAVSHGCVRVPNEIITQLAHNLPLGTPVTIH